MKLSELNSGDVAIIVKVNGDGDVRRRITEMGFVKGQQVKVVKSAPLKDPIEYVIMGYEISLRRNEASMIEVTQQEVFEQVNIYPQTLDSSRECDNILSDKNIINVALVGNPNSGKTTLFNYLSGLHEHVGNYSGVTIGAKTATIYFNEYIIKLTDLPGTYSLSAFSPEEVFVREHIANCKPDIILNVLDATNLERNLYLTTQLIDIEANSVIALNMYDEFQKSGDKFEHQTLSDMLNIPIVPVSAKRGRGIKNLLQAVVDRYNNDEVNRRVVRINYGLFNENCISKVEALLGNSSKSNFPNRFTAIKILEGDKVFIDGIVDDSTLSNIQKEREKIVNNSGDSCETILTDARYGFISGALKETFAKGDSDRNKHSRVIDSILTNKYFGFPIFFFIMWAIFYATFTFGEYPQMAIEWLVANLQMLSQSVLPEGAINDLVTNGIIGGVGSVIVFLPNILILFLFISILEDTGYMARAAFIMDKLMHKIGLHGKSFIPMVMGFGCSVPAIMATRIIENKENRILTMLLTPFMSCSAKLPVYILFIGIFFEGNEGNVLFGIYLFGIVMAVLTALIFNKFMFNSKDKPFVMELPPYRMPYAKSSLRHMWEKGSQYLKKMGGIILIAVVIIWVLSYFPQNLELKNKLAEEKAVVENLYKSQSLDSEIATNQLDSIIHVMDKEYAENQLSNSYLARIGKSIEPIFRPLGFDWKMSVCLTTGVAAKEIIVSTMGVINNIDVEEDGGESALKHNLLNEKYNYGERKGEKVYSKAVVLSFLVFTLIYLPCVAAVAAIKRESGSNKWMYFNMIYSSGLAWLMSFIVYNIAKLI